MKKVKNWQNPVVYVHCGKTRNPLSTNPSHRFQMFMDDGELKIVTNIKGWCYEDCATTYFLTSLLDQPNYYEKMIEIYKDLRDNYALINSFKKDM